MQCAVTGDSLEQLLQQSDLSLVELIMRTAVVFARMKPHQKACSHGPDGQEGHLPYVPGQGPPHTGVCPSVYTSHVFGLCLFVSPAAQHSTAQHPHPVMQERLCGNIIECVP